jgi:hypothetical protein
MHLTPARGIWCLSQSNTNSGHDIPSGPATRPSSTATSQNRLEGGPSCEISTPDRLRARRLEGRCDLRLRGLNYADIVDALGAYTACDTRFARA